MVDHVRVETPPPTAACRDAAKHGPMGFASRGHDGGGPTSPGRAGNRLCSSHCTGSHEGGRGICRYANWASSSLGSVVLLAVASSTAVGTAATLGALAKQSTPPPTPAEHASWPSSARPRSRCPRGCRNSEACSVEMSSVLQVSRPSEKRPRAAEKAVLRRAGTPIAPALPGQLLWRARRRCKFLALCSRRPTTREEKHTSRSLLRCERG